MKNQQPDMDNSRLEALLKLTAQRLGTTPQALKEAAQNGDLSGMVGNLEPSQNQAMQRALTDPDAAKKLLSTPQAQKLLELFGQKDNNK